MTSIWSVTLIMAEEYFEACVTKRVHVRYNTLNWLCCWDWGSDLIILMTADQCAFPHGRHTHIMLAFSPIPLSQGAIAVNNSPPERTKAWLTPRVRDTRSHVMHSPVRSNVYTPHQHDHVDKQTLGGWEKIPSLFSILIPENNNNIILRECFLTKFAISFFCIIYLKSDYVWTLYSVASFNYTVYGVYFAVCLTSQCNFAIHLSRKFSLIQDLMYNTLH